jgi:hypothetical protein
MATASVAQNNSQDSPDNAINVEQQDIVENIKIHSRRMSTAIGYFAIEYLRIWI